MDYPITTLEDFITYLNNAINWVFAVDTDPWYYAVEHEVSEGTDYISFGPALIRIDQAEDRFTCTLLEYRGESVWKMFMTGLTPVEAAYHLVLMNAHHRFHQTYEPVTD